MFFRGARQGPRRRGRPEGAAGRHAKRIDTRWGRPLRPAHTHGRIDKGVLTTQPVDLLYPWDAFYMPTDQYMWGARLQLK
jgi:hypothetical protein